MVYLSVWSVVHPVVLFLNHITFLSRLPFLSLQSAPVSFHSLCFRQLPSSTCFLGHNTHDLDGPIRVNADDPTLHSPRSPVRVVNMQAGKYPCTVRQFHFLEPTKWRRLLCIGSRCLWRRNATSTIRDSGIGERQGSVECVHVGHPKVSEH